MFKRINISDAIEAEQKRIRRMRRLRPKLQRLIDEAAAAEKGNSSLTDAEWGRLRSEVEAELLELGLLAVHRAYDPVGRSYQETVEWPRVWSQVEVL